MPGAEAPFPSSTACVEPHSETRLPDAARSWRQVWSDHAYILPSIFLSLIVCAWFVTWGDWKFFEPEDFCGFYDAQARSLIEGRLDVPAAAIGSEAFTFQGKTYGYFGIGPALLRIPLVIASSKLDGLWSRMMMMIGCSINLICIYRIVRLIRRDKAVSQRSQRLLHSLFMLCAGIGSTNVFLLGRSFTYHEAIMWGGTFALLFTWALIKYFARPGYGSLALASFFAFMSFHCRPTVGAGALLAMCVLCTILIWRRIAQPGTGQRTPRLRSNCQTAATRAHRHSRRLADTRHIFRRELRKISHLRRDSVAVLQLLPCKSPIACTAPAESKSISKTFQLDWRRISVRMASPLIATFPGYVCRARLRGSVHPQSMLSKASRVCRSVCRRYCCSPWLAACPWCTVRDR